jgi:hypothetical protein
MPSSKTLGTETIPIYVVASHIASLLSREYRVGEVYVGSTRFRRISEIYINCSGFRIAIEPSYSRADAERYSRAAVDSDADAAIAVWFYSKAAAKRLSDLLFSRYYLGDVERAGFAIKIFLKNGEENPDIILNALGIDREDIYRYRNNGWIMKANIKTLAKTITILTDYLALRRDE